MVDRIASNLALDINGERWVSYPREMKFPRYFAANYPFRGRGAVSRFLYLLHALRLDRFLLHAVEPPTMASRFGFEVAFFWPSKIRSSSRFYGYGVKDGRVVEYIKFATDEAEKVILEREAKNTILAGEIANNLFKVPKVLDVDEDGVALAVRYQPLPVDAHVCPIEDNWIARARDARRQIAAAGYMHGDFSWHNFRAAGEEFWIVDWEEMRKSGNTLVDEICFEYGLAYYWQHAPIEKVMAAFRAQYGDDVSLRTKAREAVDDLARRKITMGDMLKEALGKEGWE